MTAYLVRRTLQTIAVLLIISMVTFAISFLIPADPAAEIAGPKAKPETIEHIRQRLGLDQPFYVQYSRYLWRLLHGDLGDSYRLRMPVLELFRRRMGATAQLAVLGVLFELLMGVPVGIISAVKSRSWLDRTTMIGALVGVSAPRFWLGVVLLYLLGFKLSWVPLGGYGTLKHAILPAFTLGVAGAAWYARMLRSSMLDILGADYMRTAYAKGLPERLVLLRHAIPNAIQPVITMVGMDLGYYLGGVVVIESVFSWPGMGKEIWQAIQNLDIPVITGSVTLAALAVVLMNLVVDVVNAAIDPRIRLGEEPAA
jgi:peptide/nickel transport system permease protein